MKEYLELGKNGQLTLPPSICREAKIHEGDLFKAVIEKAGSIRLIALATEERERVEQSQMKDHLE
jgi:bifunctional DNA-binding transcriptional regulator/antitoxin component of YhaV-PrlF toxin-antitoxin module